MVLRDELARRSGIVTPVVSAGGYRVTDYIKVCMPPSILTWLMAAIVIPLVLMFCESDCEAMADPRHHESGNMEPVE